MTARSTSAADQERVHEIVRQKSLLVLGMAKQSFAGDIAAQIRLGQLELSGIELDGDNDTVSAGLRGQERSQVRERKRDRLLRPLTVPVSPAETDPIRSSHHHMPPRGDPRLLQHPRQRARRFPRLAGRPMLVLIASGPQRPWRTMDLEWSVDKPQRQLHLGGSGESLLGGLACLVPVPLFEPAYEVETPQRVLLTLDIPIGRHQTRHHHLSIAARSRHRSARDSDRERVSSLFDPVRQLRLWRRRARSLGHRVFVRISPLVRIWS